MEWRTGLAGRTTINTNIGQFGRKRRPTDELIDGQPLAKRLSLLHLTTIGKGLQNCYRYGYPEPNEQRQQQTTQQRQRQHGQVIAQEEGRMEVDNVVYVDSLDSDSDSDGGDSKVIFLSDIDRKLTKIPYNLCSGSSEKERLSPSTELVLYSVPTSLTVPEQKDSVRRAIIEARARMRQKQAAEAEMQMAAAAAAAATTATLGPAQIIQKVADFGDFVALEKMEVEDGVDAMDIE